MDPGGSLRERRDRRERRDGVGHRTHVHRDSPEAGGARDRHPHPFFRRGLRDVAAHAAEDRGEAAFPLRRFRVEPVHRDAARRQGGRRQEVAGRRPVPRDPVIARSVARAGSHPEPPRPGPLDPHPAAGHHAHRQVEIGSRYRIALQCDRDRAGGAGGGEEQAARELAALGSGDGDGAAVQPARADRERRETPGGPDVRAERAQRRHQARDRPLPDPSAPGDGDGSRHGGRRRGEKAQQRPRLADRDPRGTAAMERGSRARIDGRPPHLEAVPAAGRAATQRVHGRDCRPDVFPLRKTPEAGRPVGEGGGDQEPVRLVLAAGNPDRGVEGRRPGGDLDQSPIAPSPASTTSAGRGKEYAGRPCSSRSRTRPMFSSTTKRGSPPRTFLSLPIAASTGPRSTPAGARTGSPRESIRECRRSSAAPRRRARGGSRSRSRARVRWCGRS